MTSKRKRALNSSSAKARKRRAQSGNGNANDGTQNPNCPKPSTVPIQANPSARNESTDVSSTPPPISSLPSEILTQILSHILARGQITLHSRSGRRWKNELHSLTTVDWNKAISVGCRDFFVPRKAYKSDLLDILLVSREFYFAGINAFFGYNLLKFDNVHHLDRLTRTLDLDRRRCVRHICFKATNFYNGLIPVGHRETIGPTGASLGTCLLRLPLLQTVRLIYQAPPEQSQQFTYSVLPKLRENFEYLKEWVGEGGSKALRLEVRDGYGRMIFPEEIKNEEDTTVSPPLGGTGTILSWESNLMRKSVS